MDYRLDFQTSCEALFSSREHEKNEDYCPGPIAGKMAGCCWREIRDVWLSHQRENGAAVAAMGDELARLDYVAAGWQPGEEGPAMFSALTNTHQPRQHQQQQSKLLLKPCKRIFPTISKARLENWRSDDQSIVQMKFFISLGFSVKNVG